jgi:hypothetical protein
LLVVMLCVGNVVGSFYLSLSRMCSLNATTSQLFPPI